MVRVPSIVGLLAVLTASACATTEPVAPSGRQATAGGERQADAALARRGNVASAQMEVEPRPPAPAVDPATVSSEPSALVRQPQAQPPQVAQPATTFVAAPPPAPRPEAYPTQASVDWVWAPGYWYWQGGQYVWVAGAWIPARRGHVYVSARWVRGGSGWMFVPGGWAVSTYDPIVYPVYPYDTFYYGHYHDRWHHHGYGHHQHYPSDRLRVRPNNGWGRADRIRPSSRLRVRAR